MVALCLVPRPHYCARPMCSSRIRHQNTLTEEAWEDAVQGLGKVALKYGGAFVGDFIAFRIF